MPEVSAGQPVWYVPSLAHWNDADKDGPLFSLLDKAGKPVRRDAEIGRDAAGRLHDHRHQPLSVGTPRKSWEATVEAVHPDGSADLTIKHPRGDHTLFYPAVPHSDGKENHTWHAGE